MPLVLAARIASELETQQGLVLALRRLHTIRHPGNFRYAWALRRRERLPPKERPFIRFFKGVDFTPRLYATPETEAWWRVARKSGVDFVGGDNLASIASVFSEPILP